MLLNARFRTSPRRGAVLLMTLLVTGMLALASLSFSSSVNSQVGLARNEVSTLHAELAAESALEYARRQLLLDPLWQGTDTFGIQIADGIFFTVTRDDQESSNVVPSEAVLTLEGRKEGFSLQRLQAAIAVDPGDPLRDKALSVLGGGMRGANIEIEGDALVVDAPGYLFDYRKGRRWVAANFSPYGVQVSRLQINGKLWKCSNKIYGPPERESRLNRSLHAPGWDFSGWEKPGPGRRIFKHPKELKNLILQETAVVILKPGEQLLLANVQLRGGLIILLDSPSASSSTPRNIIIMRGRCKIGTKGSKNKIGLLAPGCRIKAKNGRHQIFGMNLWHSVQHLRRTHCDGLTIVLNNALDLRDSRFRYDQTVAEDPPSGIEFFGALPAVKINDVNEVY